MSPEALPHALLVSGSMGGTKSQASPRTHRPRNSEMTREFSKRLRGLAERAADPWLRSRFAELGDRLQRCAVNEDGWRCDTVLCPRCSRKRAIKRRKQVEALLDQSGDAAFMTLTVGSTALDDGLRLLRRAFGRLRRRAIWIQSVLHGVAGIEVKAAGDHADIWNVHLHAVVFLHTKNRYSSPSLRGERASSLLEAHWQSVLAKLNSYGSSDWRCVVTRRVPSIARRAISRSGCARI